MSVGEIGVSVLGLVVGYYFMWLYFKGKEEPDAGSPRQAQQPLTDDPNQPTAWYDVLGVSIDATSNEIREAYQRQVSQYHPDKVATLGAELRLLAEKKTKEINAAYQNGFRARGF